MTLDDLVADPQAMATLSRDERQRLGMQAMSLAWGLFLFQDERPAMRDTHESVLTLDEAAGLLKMSPTSLRRKSAAPPHKGLRVDLGTKLLRFSQRRVNEFIRRRTG